MSDTPTRTENLVWVHNARILAAFAVVGIHVSSSVWTQTASGSPSWWIANSYDAMVRWAVPVFVMLSGALLLDPRKEESAAVFYRKRGTRLLVPILAWSAIYQFWKVAKGYIRGDIPSPVEMAMSIARGNPYYHMWFLFMMIGMYLFTPFFRTFVKKASQTEVLSLVLLSFSVSCSAAVSSLFHPSSGSGFFLGWFVTFIPYFFLGYLIRVTTFRVSGYILLPVLVAALLATVIGVFYNERFFRGGDSISMVLLSVCILLLMRHLESPLFGTLATEKVAGLTLGVYLVHPIVMESLGYVGIKAANFWPILSVPAVSVLVFAVALATSWLVSRVAYVRRIT